MPRRSAEGVALKPKISYAAAIARQIVERIQPVETVDLQIGNGGNQTALASLRLYRDRSTAG